MLHHLRKELAGNLGLSRPYFGFGMWWWDHVNLGPDPGRSYAPRVTLTNSKILIMAESTPKITASQS